MVLFAYAAYVAGAGIPTTPDALAQILGLCGLAAVGHGSLIFGGGHLETGFLSLILLLSRWLKQQMLNRNAAELIANVRLCDARFNEWKEEVRVYNRDYPQDQVPVPSVPSDLVVVRTAANELLAGRTVGQLVDKVPENT